MIFLEDVNMLKLACSLGNDVIHFHKHGKPTTSHAIFAEGPRANQVYFVADEKLNKMRHCKVN